MRLSVTSVRPPGCLRGTVVCNFVGDDGVIGVVLALDPVHARATAASLLRSADEALGEVYPPAPLPNPKDRGA